MKKVRLATVWLDGCAGCHMSILDMDETILQIAQRVELVYGPLVDTREFPKAVDVTIVEGAVSSQEDLDKLHTLRKRSKLVVSLGDCAVTGNVPTLRDWHPARKMPGSVREAVPVHEVIQVDFHLPGCPPKPESIVFVLSELIEGRMPALPVAALL